MTWTEEQYDAAGVGRLSLRLPTATLATLRNLAAATGETVSAVISRLILAESEKSTRAKKKVRSNH